MRDPSILLKAIKGDTETPHAYTTHTHASEHLKHIYTQAHTHMQRHKDSKKDGFANAKPTSGKLHKKI